MRVENKKKKIYKKMEKLFNTLFSHTDKFREEIRAKNKGTPLFSDGGSTRG